MKTQVKDFAAILADKKNKLKVEHDAKMNELETVYGALGAVYEASGVEMERGHIYPYNGRIGTLSLDMVDTYGKSLGSAEQVTALIAAFPPLPAEFITDRWKHRAVVPAGLEKYGKDEIVEREEIFGLFATVDHNTYHTQGPTVKFEWYAMVAGQIWEINIKRGLYSVDLGESNFRAKHYGIQGEGPVKSIESNSYNPKHGGKTRTFGSGGSDSAGNIEIRYAVDSEAASYTPEQWAAVIIKG